MKEKGSAKKVSFVWMEKKGKERENIGELPH